MAKINMMELVNGDLREDSKDEIEEVERFKIIQLNINDLVCSEENFYSTNDLGALQDSIEEWGLKHNLVVRKKGDKYEVISGNRRLLSLKNLYDAGNKRFEYIPCKIEKTDELENEISLIISNSTTRKLSDWEEVEQFERLKKALIKYKAKGNKLKGRMRDIIADKLNTSSAKVSRLEGISNNLTSEFKEEMKKEKVGISVAHGISKLSKEGQKEFFKEVEDKKTIQIKDVKRKLESEKEAKVESVEVLEGQCSIEAVINTEENKEEEVSQSNGYWGEKYVKKKEGADINKDAHESMKNKMQKALIKGIIPGAIVIKDNYEKRRYIVSSLHIGSNDELEINLNSEDRRSMMSWNALSDRLKVVGFWKE